MMVKGYEDYSPEERAKMDREAARGGANEARGSEDAAKARNLKPITPKRDKRAMRKMER